ncbi:DUF2690 domain-containing protein [Streptomyces sp. NBC_00487]|uniref:helix-turn-helix domain-containing protein n=1 Tax=unclassified Streptomyces TaxID=2593676 RepID=UPI002E1845BC|nr:MULTISPECIES: helix-turn-helix domain-containing protein [unclassified Streptomyces]
MTGSAPSPPGARLAVVLQQLKQRTGLSLAQLANATTFSKSSWQRYLNGKSLPPRSAVKELCRLAGEPADHPLALLDIARTDRTEDSEPAEKQPARQNTGTQKDTPAPAPTTAPPDTSLSEAVEGDPGPARTSPPGTGNSEPAPTRVAPTAAGPTTHRRATILTALASLCAVALGTLVLVHLPPSHGNEAAPSPTPPTATGPLCRHTACQNKDPITTRCGADPETLAEHETATGAWIQIRYSQECGTSWVRMWGAAVDDRVEIRAGRNGFLDGARVSNRSEADTYVHTLMSVISPGTPVQSCFTPAAGGAKECFRAPTDRTSTPGRARSGP